MDEVRSFIKKGFSIPDAIKAALTVAGYVSLTAFCEKRNLTQPNFSAVINGSTRPTPRSLAALIKELGGTEDEWRDLLYEAANPKRANRAPARAAR